MKLFYSKIHLTTQSCAEGYMNDKCAILSVLEDQINMLIHIGVKKKKSERDGAILYTSAGKWLVSYSGRSANRHHDLLTLFF